MHAGRGGVEVRSDFDDATMPMGPPPLLITERDEIDGDEYRRIVSGIENTGSMGSSPFVHLSDPSVLCEYMRRVVTIGRRLAMAARGSANARSICNHVPLRRRSTGTCHRRMDHEHETKMKPERCRPTTLCGQEMEHQQRLQFRDVEVIHAQAELLRAQAAAGALGKRPNDHEEGNGVTVSDSRGGGGRSI